jgi:coenzyme F420-reducing hydrogenase delta subunit
MEYDPSALDYWNRELHYIGGNHSVKRMESNQYFFKKIIIDERWRESISPQDSERIRDSNEIWALVDRIKEISER